MITFPVNGQILLHFVVCAALLVAHGSAEGGCSGGVGEGSPTAVNASVGWSNDRDFSASGMFMGNGYTLSTQYNWRQDTTVNGCVELCTDPRTQLCQLGSIFSKSYKFDCSPPTVNGSLTLRNAVSVGFSAPLAWAMHGVSASTTVGIGSTVTSSLSTQPLLPKSVTFTPSEGQGLADITSAVQAKCKAAYAGNVDAQLVAQHRWALDTTVSLANNPVCEKGRPNCPDHSKQCSMMGWKWIVQKYGDSKKLVCVGGRNNRGACGTYKDIAPAECKSYCEGAAPVTGADREPCRQQCIDGCPNRGI